MTERSLWAAIATLMLMIPSVAEAQEQPDDKPGNERVVIDILAPIPEGEAPNAAMIKACEDERDAAQLTQEIIVCGDMVGDPSQWLSGGREAWLKDYAERTKDSNTIPAPDVAGAGIFRGPPTVSGLCFIPPCPKDLALIIDLEALPPPPKGSDADRIARGLPPIGNEEGLEEENSDPISEEELGLPPPPQFEEPPG